MPSATINALKAPPISGEGLGRGFFPTEFNIYGSSRIGMVTQPEALTENPPDPVAHIQTLGYKVYEFSNHLGNVLTTFSDRKIAIESTSDLGFVEYYTSEILSSTDYYPFGFQMPGRVYEADGYRYGFNSMEKDDELKGSGNSYDFGARIYDPRVGRWLAVDPKTDYQPGWSTYKAFLCNPIVYIDPSGEYEFLTYAITDQRTGKTQLYTYVISDDLFMGGIVQRSELTSGNYYDARQWYDQQTTIHITIDKEGKQRVEKIETKLVGEAKVETNGPLMDKSWVANTINRIKNRTLKGGLWLVTSGGGADPTKFKSLSNAQRIDITSLMAAFGAKGKSLSIPKNVKIPDVVRTAAKTAQEALDAKEKNEERKIIETQSKIAPSTDSAFCIKCLQKQSKEHIDSFNGPGAFQKIKDDEKKTTQTK
jgi:RHS repeat-associated protein